MIGVVCNGSCAGVCQAVGLLSLGCSFLTLAELRVRNGEVAREPLNGGGFVSSPDLADKTSLGSGSFQVLMLFVW